VGGDEWIALSVGLEFFLCIYKFIIEIIIIIIKLLQGTKKVKMLINMIRKEDWRVPPPPPGIKSQINNVPPLLSETTADMPLVLSRYL